MSMLVKELMRQAVVVDRDIPLAEAARIMSEKKIGSLMLVAKTKLKGIVTERDVLKNFGKSKKISECMADKVITIGPKESVNDALAVMQEHQIKRLPVIQNDELVGIISLTDIAFHVDELDGDFFFDR